MRKWLLITGLIHIFILVSVSWQSWMHIEGAVKGCSSTGAIACDVMFSRFGYWFSIPTPFLAFGFYILSLCVVGFAYGEKNPAVQKKYTSLNSLLSWLGLLTAVYFAGASFLILKKFCPYCAVFYVGAIAHFFLARKTQFLSGEKLLLGDLLLGFKSPKVLISTLVSILMVIALVEYKPSQQTDTTVNKIQTSENRSLGPVSAKFQIVEFSDFQCPHCKLMGGILKQLEREDAGSVRVTYKFYPLDPKCNSKMPPPGHEFSCAAAAAAYCAAAQNKFWVYHDLLFANQEQLNSSLWKSFAEQSNLNLADFEACLNSSATQDALKEDIAEGDKLNVEGTPALFINGQRFEGDRTIEGIRSFLKAI